jgi:hypothetical protein
MISLDGTNELREMVAQGKLEISNERKLLYYPPENPYEDYKPGSSHLKIHKTSSKDRYSSQNGSFSPQNEVELRVETDIYKDERQAQANSSTTNS